MFVIHYSQNQIKSNIIKVVSGAEERLEIETTRNLLEQFEYKISLLVWKQFIEPEGFDIFIYRLDSNEKHLVKAAGVKWWGKTKKVDNNKIKKKDFNSEMLVTNLMKNDFWLKFSCDSSKKHFQKVDLTFFLLGIIRVFVAR